MYFLIVHMFEESIIYRYKVGHQIAKLKTQSLT